MISYSSLLQKWYPYFVKWRMLGILDDVIGRLDILYKDCTVYPEKQKVFRIFQEVSPENVKVIFLGQDPYPGIYNDEPSACGRAFATENGYLNPSLKNLFKELQDDLGIKIIDNKEYSLDAWVDDGVFLLNTALTVEKGLAGSHLKLWEQFSKEFIVNFSKEFDVVWVLLGKKAQQWDKYIINGNVISAPHPSPLAGGKFFGSKIFSKINNFKEIKWQ